MPTVHILSDEVINKIAAGEVVERPASALKELVENAIDAKAQKISVSLKDGGTSFISVKDNGLGMRPEDAHLSLRRHATSKIESSEDLFHIESKGFRGEALASISAVSKFTLQTQSKSEDGIRIRSEGGEKPEGTNWKGDIGTNIIIEDLFYNVPARRRFLKSQATEFSYCQEFLQAASLAHPEVSFSLKHNDKAQWDVPAVDVESKEWKGEKALRSRAKLIVKDDVAEKLLYKRHETDFGRVEMLLSPPGVEKATGKSIHMFVNNRWVKDKLVRMGVMRGYHSHLLKGKFPVCIVHVYVDPTLVDVNVHPAKTELRFQYGSEVQSLIAICIKNAIREGDWAMPEVAVPYQTPQFALRQQDKMNATQGDAPRSSRTMSYHTSSYQSRPSGVSTQESRSSHSEKELFSGGRDVPISQSRESGIAESFEMSREEISMEERQKVDWRELKYCGAYAKCYLFFEAHNGLLVVDQHAFHERVLYERFMADSSLITRSQSLLMPEEVLLDVEQVEWLQEQKDLLHKHGFVFSIAGKDRIEVQGVPAIISHRNIDDLFNALSSGELAGDQEDSPKSVLHLLVATMACHAAVRAGEELGENELAMLLGEADTVDFYHNCPHGRPVFQVV